MGNDQVGVAPGTLDARHGPVQAASRIAGMDVLRGVALLGVFLVNLPSMAMPTSAVVATPNEAWPLTETITWAATHALLEFNFITMFSMLFGAGLILQARSAEQRGARFGALYARRLGLLFVFGVIHAVTLFMGDILTSYAIIGSIVFLFRSWTPSRMTLIACALLLVSGFLIGGLHFISFEGSDTSPAPWQPDAGLTPWTGAVTPELLWTKFTSTDAHASARVELLIFREGPWSSQLLLRGATYAITLTVGLALLAWQLFATFLLGAALMKAKLFEPEGHTLRRRLCFGGLTLGLTGEITSTAMLLNSTTPGDSGLAHGIHCVTAVVLGLGYAGAVLIWVERGLDGDGLGARLRRALASTGRMALTHYLCQSIVGVFLFTSLGLGLYGTIGRPGLIVLGLVIFSLQVLVSPWWFARFRYGPFEWLWRALTYGPRRL